MTRTIHEVAKEQGIILERSLSNYLGQLAKLESMPWAKRIFTEVYDASLAFMKGIRRDDDGWKVSITDGDDEVAIVYTKPEPNFDAIMISYREDDGQNSLALMRSKGRIIKSGSLADKVNHARILLPLALVVNGVRINY